MAKEVNDIIRMIHRIKTSPEGIDFIEYLEELSHDNYLAFKRCDVAQNEFHKGYAFAIDNIIRMFKECDKIINEIKEVVPDWTN